MTTTKQWIMAWRSVVYAWTRFLSMESAIIDLWWIQIRQTVNKQLFLFCIINICSRWTDRDFWISEDCSKDSYTSNSCGIWISNSNRSSRWRFFCSRWKRWRFIWCSCGQWIAHWHWWILWHRITTRWQNNCIKVNTVWFKIKSWAKGWLIKNLSFYQFFYYNQFNLLSIQKWPKNRY